MKKVAIVSLGKLGQDIYDQCEGKYEIIGTYCHSPKGQRDQTKYDFNNDDLPSSISSADYIIFNLPPSKMDSLELFERFMDQTSACVIFISSTSVYGQNGVVDEKTIPDPVTNNGKFLIECERIILDTKIGKIIRPAGLYSKTRHPGKSLSGKQDIMGGNCPVNLVAHDDLIQLIVKCIDQETPRLINAVNIHHPQKEEYYLSYCQKNDLPLPSFKHTDMISKSVTTCYPEFKISSELP